MFLKEMAEYYEITVFTAAVQEVRGVIICLIE
jgi:hypothetical protein